MQYCSLLHWLYLNHQSHSWLGLFALAQPLHSFELFLHSSPVTYWSPTDLGSSSFSVISFCLFILFMGFSRQEYWSGLPFPSPVGHVLSELSSLTHPSCVSLHSMAQSSCDCGFHSVCPLMVKNKRLVQTALMRGTGCGGICVLLWCCILCLPILHDCLYCC